MQILFVGDIVGSPGGGLSPGSSTAFARSGTSTSWSSTRRTPPAAAGDPALAEELLAAGADVLTLGDHAWDQKELADGIDLLPRVLRPANFAPGCPGRGWCTVQTPAGPATVVSLLGRVFMNVPCDCPFRAADRLLGELPRAAGPVLVDFHAEATSEKIAMGRHLDGRVAAVVGTHTHVQTSDETILPGGTAYLTDLGMTGPKDSVLGRDVESVMTRFLTGMPARFRVAAGQAVLEGLLLETDDDTGRARRVERVRVPAGE